MITKPIAIALRHGATLYHKVQRDSRGAPLRCRVSGKCQTWKSRPEDFRIPVIHGLKNYFAITPANGDEWQIDMPQEVK